MIKENCNQKPPILGILSSGNLCLRNQFYSKLLETASTASDLKCLKIQVIWDHAPSNWTIWGWQKAVIMKFKHLLENVVIFWTQPQQPPYQPLRSNLFWGPLRLIFADFGYQGNSKSRFESFYDIFRNSLRWPQNGLGGQIQYFAIKRRLRPWKILHMVIHHLKMLF